MPVGVVISTALRTGPTNPTGPESSAWFVAGVTEKGPVEGDISPVYNISEYENVWGPRGDASGTLYDQAMTFFAEGGSTLYVARAVGPAATSSSVTLKNTNTTPQDALKVEAISPGAWGQTLKFEVLAGGLAGTMGARVLSGTTVVETYANKATVAALAVALGSSRYVKATLLGAANPDADLATGSFALVGGDGDEDAVGVSDILAALDRFGEDYGPGAASVPGYSADLVATSLASHCRNTNRVGIVAGEAGASKTELGNLAGQVATGAEYFGLFAPWVIIPDGSATRTISPEGYVAGVRSRAFAIEDAFWQVPAGQRANARFILGTEVDYDLADINDLADNYRVSGIITRRSQVYLYQYRSLSTNEEQWELLSSRDTINGLVGRLSAALEPFVWEVIDGKHQLESAVTGAMVGVLQPISDQNGLYAEYDADGGQIHPGYVVSATSTPDQLGHNVIAAKAAVKLSPFAGLIEIELVKASFTAPLV